MTNTQSTRLDSSALAAAMAEGLRALANAVDASPELAESMRYCGVTSIGIPADDRAELVAVVRALKAAGAEVKKSGGDKYFTARCSFGPVVLEVSSLREEVCERVVVGTETVTKQVPDPAKLAEVPLVEVTESVEHVGWKCHPLLAESAEAAALTGSAATS